MSECKCNMPIKEKVHYRGALGCTLPHVWLVCTYLVFDRESLILYTPCSEPSRTVLLFDVMYATDPRKLTP